MCCIIMCFRLAARSMTSDNLELLHLRDLRLHMDSQSTLCEVNIIEEWEEGLILEQSCQQSIPSAGRQVITSAECCSSKPWSLRSWPPVHRLVHPCCIVYYSLVNNIAESLSCRCQSSAPVKTVSTSLTDYIHHDHSFTSVAASLVSHRIANLL